MDPRLAEQYPLEAAMETAALILRCLEFDRKIRPSMDEVSETLIKIKDMKEKPMRSKSSRSNGSYAKRQEESFRHRSPFQHRHGGAGYNGSNLLPGFERHGADLFILLSLKDRGTSASLWTVPDGEAFLASINQDLQPDP
ncbi:hypothetical protein SADUNF_Sadunf02G0006800 [Salix dunnii]|uniref:Uncharacterized protein n=1 Tax=Salix dunnii TaxID=1413687 RepID=A0A835N5K0_9ROSI|nr:hypothetical protein SADUNF_Sadunf02G0006800 [Salix dunnii]